MEIPLPAGRFENVESALAGANETSRYLPWLGQHIWGTHDEFVYQPIRAHEMDAFADVHIAVVGKRDRLPERQIDLGQNRHGVHYQCATVPISDRMPIEG